VKVSPLQFKKLFEHSHQVLRLYYKKEKWAVIYPSITQLAERFVQCYSQQPNALHAHLHFYAKEQGYTTKNKMCIAGGSYGGYAALMALVKHPDTFQCAASFAGVSDLDAIYSSARYFTNKDIVRKQIGTDRDKLEQVSPINFAGKMTKPVLLIHGSEDSVVSVKHSRLMAEELEDAEKEVKYIELKDGSHYLKYQPYRVRTLQEMLAFFDKHLM